MAFWPQFVGGFYKTLSPTFAADTAVNIYQETREVPGSPKQVTIVGTPGLLLEATAATVFGRGTFTENGRTFVVIGDTLYERTAVGTFTSRGTITNDNQPVSFASNGRGGDQIGIVGGGELKVFDTSTDTLSAAIALPFVGPVMIAFLDGYGLILEADSPIVWFSALENLTSWDALDFFARSGTSDNLVGIAVTRDRVWCLGGKTTTLFYNSGDADTPFLPYPGTASQWGLASPWLLTVQHDQLFWITSGESGQRHFVTASDSGAQVLSTPPIARFLRQATSFDGAILDSYEQNGHWFAVVTVPDHPDDICTYAFDAREKLWHARSGWNTMTGQHVRWPAQHLIAVGGDVLALDAVSGNIYTLSLTTYTNNGDILMRERTAPYLSTENQWLFLQQIELGVQPGVGLSSGQGSDPQVMLDISRDAAHTWVSVGFAPIGAVGQYLTRAIWQCRCRIREDRLSVRVRQSDAVPCVWTGMWIRASSGTGQL